MDFEQVESSKGLLTEKLFSISPSILIKFPLNKYYQLFSVYQKYYYNKHIPEEVLLLNKTILVEFGQTALEIYNKLFLVYLFENRVFKSTSFILTEELEKEQKRKIEIIIFNIARPTTKPGIYLFPHERFIYSLDIIRGATLAYGPFRITSFKPNIFSIFKYVILRFPILRILTDGIRLLAVLSKSSPCLELHVDVFDKDTLKYFAPEGWKKLFNAVGYLLMENNNLKGFVGNSWFLDPEMIRISPELSYIRNIIAQLGGRFYFFGSDASGIKNATRTNIKRMRLFIENKYKPTNYYFFLPSNYMLKEKN